MGASSIFQEFVKFGPIRHRPALNAAPNGRDAISDAYSCPAVICRCRQGSSNIPQGPVSGSENPGICGLTRTPLLCQSSAQSTSSRSSRGRRNMSLRPLTFLSSLSPMTSFGASHEPASLRKISASGRCKVQCMFGSAS